VGGVFEGLEGGWIGGLIIGAEGSSVGLIWNWWSGTRLKNVRRRCGGIMKICEIVGEFGSRLSRGPWTLFLRSSSRSVAETIMGDQGSVLLVVERWAWQAMPSCSRPSGIGGSRRRNLDRRDWVLLTSWRLRSRGGGECKIWDEYATQKMMMISSGEQGS